MEKESQNSFNDKEDSFEDMLNKSFLKHVRLQPGEKVEGIIIKVTDEWVFIDIGSKSEGYISTKEFEDDEGNVTVEEGGTIDAYFLSARDNEMLFTTRLGGDAMGKEHLKDAFRSGIPIEGHVENEVKGGYEIKIAGNIRAFCPYSQMRMVRSENQEDYTGKNMTFQIIEYDEKGRNIVVSNKHIYEKERQKRKEVLMENLREGMTVRGEITSIRDFGAFVDIGGIEGLIPVSEISWSRVENINTVLSLGQKVDVIIKKLNWEEDKYSFSLKEVIPNPWNEIDLKYPEGSRHKGKVSRLTSFGAFITLEPGIDGLIHISELGKGKRIMHPRKVLEENQAIEVKVSKIDKDGKRLSLEMIREEYDSDEGDYEKHISVVQEESSKPFGTLGDILRAKINEKDKKNG